MDDCFSRHSRYLFFMRRYRIYVYKSPLSQPILNMVEGKALALKMARQLSKQGTVRVEDDEGKVIYELSALRN
mgnify:FL=1